MTSGGALIVTESAEPPAGLPAALMAMGLRVRTIGPAELTGQPGLVAGQSVVLISAGLGLSRVALLSQWLGTPGDGPPVLVFGDGDPADLEACARGGFDYVTAPFLPGLLSNRLTPAQERSDLAEVVEAMATQASLQAYERDLADAQRIQASFLSAALAPPGWETAVRYRPARVVSGDFYDGFELPDGRRTALVVADVCDKGLSAALYMALIRTLLRNSAEHVPPGAAGAGILLEVVTDTNLYLARHHREQGYFVTLFFGVLDPASGDLVYLNAGHNPPVLLHPDGRQVLLPATGPALGLDADSTFTVRRVRLAPGDALVAYTDGVIEDRAPGGEMFGTDRLLDALRTPVTTMEELAAVVDARLAAHQATAAQYDDITMVLVRWPPEHPGR
jgi:sigma-B regulation protein RsbU (phosphoserine phosphatase)